MEKKKSAIQSIFSGKVRKILLILFFDIAFAVGSFVLARFIFFFRLTPEKGYVTFEVLIAAVFVLVTVAMLVFFDCYNIVWKYAGRVEFFKVSVAYFASAATLLLFKVIMEQAFAIFIASPHILMYLLFSILLSAGMRYSYGIRNYIRHLRNRMDKKAVTGLKTVVIGAGYTGTAYVNRCINNPSDGYFPVALLDDDPEKQRKKIHGVFVEGGRDKLGEAVTKYGAQMIVIAITSLTKPELKELYAQCVKFALPIKILTDIKDAGAGEFTNQAPTLRDIKIEELLGRDEFKVNQELLDDSVKGKTVLVTGGAGSIGSELCRQAIGFGCKHLIVFDNHENGMFELNEEFKEKYGTEKYSLVIGSVRETRKLSEVFSKFRPEIVFHAAAYKHVPMMEISATEAVKNNVFGTLNVIRAAENAGAERFVFISTDKAVNPANIMGATKRIAEMIVQDIGSNGKMQMAAVRFGNVLGSNGSVIPIFLRQIKEGGPITLTDRNIKRYFMTIPEAVRLVLQAGSLAKKGDVFVLDMGEPVYIYDLACDLCRISGLVPEKDVEIRVTGLRQGEKMFEELRYDQESVDATAHEGIFVTRLEPVDPGLFKQRLKLLEDAALLEDDERTAGIIFEIVPSVYRNMQKEAQENCREFLEQGVRNQGSQIC